MILSNRLEAEFSKRDIVMVLYTCAHSTHTDRDEGQRTTTDRDGRQRGGRSCTSGEGLSYCCYHYYMFYCCYYYLSRLQSNQQPGGYGECCVAYTYMAWCQKVGGLPYSIDSRVESFYSTIYAYSLQLLIVEFTTVLHHAKYQYRCSWDGICSRINGGTTYSATDGPRGTVYSAVDGAGGPLILPRTVRGDRFWGGPLTVWHFVLKDTEKRTWFVTDCGLLDEWDV